MRLAFVETAPFGGLLHYAAQFADAIAVDGHEVDLVATRGNEMEGRLAHARMRAVLTPTVKDTEAHPNSAVGRFVRRLGVAARLTRCWLEVANLMRSGRYDMVVINSDIYYTVAVAALLLGTMLPGRPPVVFICHNSKPIRPGREGEHSRIVGSQRFLLRRLFPRLQVVLLHGESSLRDFTTDWPGIPTALIPHGDESMFGEEVPPPATEQRVLFFGIWRRVKGISVLMEAFDRLAERLPEAKLTMAGTPFPEDLDLPALDAWARGHGDRVELIDRYVPVEEVPAIFARGRVVALPYLMASQSGVIHLAMTMSRTVVASEIGDLPEVVIEGETGLLVPPGDPRRSPTRSSGSSSTLTWRGGWAKRRASTCWRPTAGRRSPSASKRRSG